MIEWATGLVGSTGLLGVFLLMVAENLFPPIPSEVIMPLAGNAAANGRYSLAAVIAVGTAGAVVGNAVWFELARGFGAARARTLLGRHGARLGLGPAAIAQGEAVLRRRGAAAVFLGRFMPGVRTAISVPAGVIEMPRPLFYGWTTLGTLIWTGGLAAAGFWLGDDFAAAERWAGPIGLVALGAGVAFVVWRVWKSRRSTYTAPPGGRKAGE